MALMVRMGQKHTRILFGSGTGEDRCDHHGWRSQSELGLSPAMEGGMFVAVTTSAGSRILSRLRRALEGLDYQLEWFYRMELSEPGFS